jgi:microcystin-dependent protein
MPDTFTTNLNLTKPEVGASRDTWGTKLNANMDSLDTQIHARARKDANLSDLTNVGTARTNLGLGTAATRNIGTSPGNVAELAGDGKIPTSLLNLPASVDPIPVGSIIMWSGSIASIPAGWALCNGTNGTPDLRDRFIVGAGTTYTPGATGGAATNTLSAANLPAHTHTFSATTSSDGSHGHTGSTDSAGNHSHTVNLLNSGFNNTNNVYNEGTVAFTNAVTNTAGAHAHNLTINSAGAHTHTLSGTTSSIGSGTAVENRPPYYALAFIMKV